MFTFKLREGLKWSDGEPVTMEDVEFWWNDILKNTEYTPSDTYYADCILDKVDDWTFTFTFETPKPLYLTFWAKDGNSRFVYPAHYLKQFHPSYLTEDEMAAKLAEESFDDWKNLMQDKTNVQTNKDLPVLGPWVMTTDPATTNTYLYERNPYYCCVDQEGNQLPYCDYITNVLVENQEMLQMKVITGEIDYLRESATIDNLTLYRENEEAAGIKVHFYSLNNTPTDIMVNFNYGLDTDGTVKDDEASQAWQEVVNDHRFLEALACAVDIEEIIDAVYSGFAEPDQYFTALYTYDPEYANSLLDEMGMADVDGDGYRETPSGKKLQWMITNNGGNSDFLPVSELMVEFWQTGLGLSVTANTIESSLMATSQSANELPMTINIAPIDITWFNNNWGQGAFGPLWNTWYSKGGMKATRCPACPPPATRWSSTP